MNPLIQNALKYAQGMPSNPTLGLGELGLIKKKVHEKIDREEENNNLVLEDMTFGDHPIASTNQRRIQKIIDATQTLALPLKLYAGQATVHYWSGQQLDQRESIKIPVYKLINEHGHQLIFKLVCPEAGAQPFKNYGRVHVVLYLVENDDQGSFYKSNHFINEQIKPLLLDHVGYNCLYGRATYSSNTTVKGNPDREDDWRWQFRFMGWDSSHRPIYINKLYLFYLRLGFIADVHQQGEVGSTIHEVQARQIVLLSEAGIQRTKDWIGDDAWNEFNKYNRKNNREWQELQRQRIKEIDMDPHEQDELKRRALKETMKAQEILRTL
jgi:hypothetical protein